MDSPVKIEAYLEALHNFVAGTVKVTKANPTKLNSSVLDPSVK
jgi:hypothetical protein